MLEDPLEARRARCREAMAAKLENPCCAGNDDERKLIWRQIEHRSAQDAPRLAEETHAAQH
jgi:hypothetical protein